MWKNKERGVNKVLKTKINFKSNFYLPKGFISNPHVIKKQNKNSGLLQAYLRMYTYSHP